MPTQNNSFTFMCAPSGPLPLCPGPRPASTQIRPASQGTNTVISESPAYTYSGLTISLMEQGLISFAPPNPPQVPHKVNCSLLSSCTCMISCTYSFLINYSDLQDAVGIDFNAEFLKVRHDSSINALYCDLSRQCKTCGMHFKSQEEHGSHMDCHVTKNRIAKSQKRKPSRNWYASAKE